MPLPVRLGAGIISLYEVYSPNNISSFKSGTVISAVVDQLYATTPMFYSVGDIVMIDKEKAYAVAFENTPYYLVEEQDIIPFIENVAL